VQTIPWTTAKPTATPARSSLQIACSTAIHVLILLSVFGVLHRSKGWVAPYRLPGTQHGTNFVVSYSPDRAPAQSAPSKSKPDAKPAAPKSLLPTPVVQTSKRTPPPTSNAPASPNPNSTNGQDSLGTGNITLALTSYFPPPHPDLSVLPHGTKGDVILDVVIGTDGRISDLKKTSGIGYGIDELVIATVQQWKWSPALQNGHPVASEQELHFHYEHV
jgi:protein TonB